MRMMTDATYEKLLKAKAWSEFPNLTATITAAKMIAEIVAEMDEACKEPVYPQPRVVKLTPEQQRVFYPERQVGK